MVEIKKNYRRLPEPDKIDLIYSFNRTTPLFVRKADSELEKNNMDEAIEILTKGLKAHPNFAASYLLLGKVYALRGDYTLAIENIKKGSDLIHSEKTFDFYLNEMDNIKNKISLGFSSFNEIEERETEEQPDKNEKFDIKYLPKDDKLEELVKEISPETETHIKVEKAGTEKVLGKNIIVSETLAKIYISQGEYKEAIEIYNLLKEKHPDKADYFAQKIEELKTKFS
jgi:tetratricopeptide (TPR) repeat protein